jgi:hypothetical protein
LPALSAQRGDDRGGESQSGHDVADLLSLSAGGDWPNAHAVEAAAGVGGCGAGRCNRASHALGVLGRAESADLDDEALLGRQGWRCNGRRWRRKG